MPPSGVDYASRFLNGYAPEYVVNPKNRILTQPFIIVRYFLSNNKRGGFLVTVGICWIIFCSYCLCLINITPFLDFFD